MGVSDVRDQDRGFPDVDQGSFVVCMREHAGHAFSLPGEDLLNLMRQHDGSSLMLTRCSVPVDQIE